MSSIAPAAELCGSAALKKLLSVTDERRKESDNNRTASVSDSLDSGKIFRISADRIIPNHAQPRKLFDEDAILRLADRIWTSSASFCQKALFPRRRARKL